jgi:hypothetical protein
LRWNPLGRRSSMRRLKPFVAAGLVPVSSADSESRRRTTVGGRVGVGVDLHARDILVLSLNVHFNAVPELRRPSGLHDNFGGLEISSGAGFVFGRRR